MILDHAIDDDDEGAGRPTDLHPAAARRRDDEAADDRGHQSDEGRAARRDGDRDAQRQRDQRAADPGPGIEIGRAACRERVWTYVLISVVAGALKIQYNTSNEHTIRNEQTNNT